MIAVLARFSHGADSGEIAIHTVHIFKIGPGQGCRKKFGKAIYKMPKLDLILGYGHRTTPIREIATEMAHELPFRTMVSPGNLSQRASPFPDLSFLDYSPLIVSFLNPG